MNTELLQIVEDCTQKQKVNLYPRQKKELLGHVNITEELEEVLKGLNCFIAGGAITSIFSGKEVNDLDIYFTGLEELCAFIAIAFDCDDLLPEKYQELPELGRYSLRYTGHTKKSVMFTDSNGMQVQLIHCAFHETPESIFDSFDFSINMAAYDFKNECFVLDQEFLPDLAARRLAVNTGTSFPIISQLRIDKYKQRGFDISRKEFVKLSLAVANMDINSWDDAMDAIGSMYGYNYDELFDTNVDFSLDEMISQLEDLECRKFDTAKPCEIECDCEELIEAICEQHTETIPDQEYFYYKKVIKVEEGHYTGLYKKQFKYEDGKEVSDTTGNGIYLFRSLKRCKDFGYSNDSAIIKLSSGKNKAILKSDGGGGKYSTNTPLTVVGEVEYDKEQCRLDNLVNF